MSFAQHATYLYDPVQIGWLKLECEDRCLRDPNAACFAVSEQIARGFKLDHLSWRKQRSEINNGTLGKVFVSKSGIPFSIIDPTPENGLEYPIAVSMTELAVSDVARIMELSLPLVDGELPYVIRDLSLAYRICNRVSELDGINQEQWIPIPQDRNYQDIVVDPNKPCYRCYLTENEWNAACRVSGIDPSYLGVDLELSSRFAWTAENARLKLKKPGLLLPNENGLLDLFGNAYEITIKPEANGTRFSARGVSVRAEANLISAHRNYEFLPKHLLGGGSIVVGLRLVRPISNE